ncbi:MAG: EAL domain-containing protein [Christensenella sp.]|nr:EAL domain-containing protein [Christensenella sp.]
MAMLKTILVVDDNNVNRQILDKILNLEYHILQAANGQAALDILRNNQESISVVLLDIVMPVLDGYEVLRQMREDAFLSKIPVIVASGQDSDDAEIKALSLGANDYIVKPYKPEIIRHRVANTIYLKETSAFVNSVQNDTLTGLYGKEYFYMKVGETLRGNPEQKYDLVCFDIERFKLVNDRYGTQIGDELLRHIGQILRNKIQGFGFCARLEADEFACLIPHREYYEKSDFTDSIEKINALSNMIKLSLILRYGIYTIDDPTVPVDIMCDRADLAKESIKGKYDTYFACYDDSLRQKLLDEQMIVSDMKTALTEGQFRVYFQPKYDLKTEQIAGAEALVRWQHPVKGLLSPAQFIPIFEKNGFIPKLDYYVWEQSCRKLREWKESGNAMVPISVNVSRVDIYDSELPEKVLSLIQKYELAPRNLHLEITESAYMENPEQLIETVSRLKKMGFIIEMDDFGTGYSSLNMLSELPIDVLKLDIRFIQLEAQKSGDRSVLSFIISLAKWMNLKVVAEGTETLEQIKLLQSLGCEYAQGYYYAQPLPQEQFEQHLQKAQLAAGEHWYGVPIDIASDESDQRKILLMIDRDAVDFPILTQECGREYRVERAEDAAQALAVLMEKKDKVCALTVSLPDKLSIKQASELLEACKKYSLPAMLLYDPVHRPSDKLIKLGFSDYTVRPYEPQQFALRLQNAISNARMEKFEHEKEINAAIIEMRKRAEHDTLTGLLNRAEYEVRIDHFFLKNNDPKGIFIILDVDNFKTINDTYGHVVGDKVLNAVGERLCRVFPETEIIARIGGDEFSLFIPYILPFIQLKDKMSQICMPFHLNIENIELSCTAGICYCPEYGSNHKDLYKNADTALLGAKRQGKRQFAVFNPSMEITAPAAFEEKTMEMLDHVSDVMFVCDAVSSKIIYINETACRLLGKARDECLGCRCYELFWDRCRNCDRCETIGHSLRGFYEETTFLKDNKTPVHIKARLERWDGKAVKVHYLHVGETTEKQDAKQQGSGSSAAQ